VLLEDKNAVVYGGGGAIGGAVARALAGEGARVYLAGRTRERLEEVAADIREAGGTAEEAVVDALDGGAVDAHAHAVAARAGSIDVCLNVISHGDVQGTPMVEMSVEDYLRPVETAVRTTFLTSTAAGRHMARQGSGVILAFGGSGESMRRQLSSELGRHGVRFVTLRSCGALIDW
jgi:NAD(P)-dependent dehydrogenase (short-subunit alcohol dehydrogenase family)